MRVTTVIKNYINSTLERNKNNEMEKLRKDYDVENHNRMLSKLYEQTSEERKNIYKELQSKFWDLYTSHGFHFKKRDNGQPMTKEKAMQKCDLYDVQQSFNWAFEKEEEFDDKCDKVKDKYKELTDTILYKIEMGEIKKEGIDAYITKVTKE